MKSTSIDGLGGTYNRLWISLFKLVKRQASFLQNDRMAMLPLFIKKTISEMLKTTSCIIFTHMWYSIECLIYNVINDFLFDNNIFLQTRQDLDQVTLASMISFLLITKFWMHLIKNLKYMGYLLTLQRLLKRYDMMILV